MFGLGQAHWFRGEFVDAERVLTAGLPHLRGAFRTRRTGTTGTASVLTLVCLAKTHAMTGYFDAAFALATEAKAVAADTALPYDLSYARLADGFAHFVRGAHRAAIAELEAALAICRAAGIRLLQPSIARYLARAYAECDRIEEAHALLDEALSYTTAQSLVGLTAWCGTARGYAHLRGMATQAEAVLEEAIAVARRHGYRPVAAHALRALGEAQMNRPTPALAEAEQSYRAAADLARGMGMRPELAECLAGPRVRAVGGRAPSRRRAR